MKDFSQLVDEVIIQKTIQALKQHGIEAMVVGSREEAKTKVLEMLPQKAQVMTMSSTTLEEVGLDKAVNESGKYDAVRPKLYAMDRKTQGREIRVLGAAPEWAIGSVNAVTEDGKLLIASNTGSQLPAYVYGSDHVIWVVGTQKITANLEEGLDRIYTYTLPLESERVKKAYGMPGSAVNKLLIINNEIKPGRLTLIFVKEKLGY